LATMGFRPYPGPDATKIVYLPEVVSATFKQGDPVVISGGYVTIATDDDDIFGIAMCDYTGTTGADTPVYVITPGDRFIAEATSTTVSTNVGVAYALTISAGASGVNTASTTTPAFYIDELDPRDGATTGAGGRVIGRFVYGSMDAIGG